MRGYDPRSGKEVVVEPLSATVWVVSLVTGSGRLGVATERLEGSFCATGYYSLVQGAFVAVLARFDRSPTDKELERVFRFVGLEGADGPPLFRFDVVGKRFTREGLALPLDLDRVVRMNRQHRKGEATMKDKNEKPKEVEEVEEETLEEEAEDSDEKEEEEEEEEEQPKAKAKGTKPKPKVKEEEEEEEEEEAEGDGDGDDEDGDSEAEEEDDDGEAEDDEEEEEAEDSEEGDDPEADDEPKAKPKKAAKAKPKPESQPKRKPGRPKSTKPKPPKGGTVEKGVYTMPMRWGEKMYALTVKAMKKGASVHLALPGKKPKVSLIGDRDAVKAAVIEACEPRMRALVLKWVTIGMAKLGVKDY